MCRAFFCFLLLIAPSARAEVYLCTGVWTDIPCQEKPRPQPEPTTEESQVQLAKERIVTDLSRFANKVQAELGRTDFEADGTRDFCTKPEVSIEECRARALKADKSLMASLQAFSRIRQRSIELAQHQQEIALRRERQMRELTKRKPARVSSLPGRR